MYKDGKAPSLTSHPGDGWYYAICDVCGFKFRRKELILITDKYNQLYNLLVCKQDYTEAHPQNYLKYAKERPMRKLKNTRPEGDPTFKE